MAAGSVHTPIRPLISATGFNPIAYACANSERDSRFPVGGILQLVALLRLLVLIMTERGDRCTVEEAMCILMYRLNYHRRLHNMERKLRVVGSIVSDIEGKLYFHKRLIRERIQSYCSAIQHELLLLKCLLFQMG
ncbi:hypothetical protein PF008_g1477 [Phytophthora fragariae]|nr:hypothetical protein PF008_g1477 [Phytophthora fragariae]